MCLEFFLWRSILFFVRLCDGKVVGEQPASRLLQKVFRPRGSARNANIERPSFSAVNRLKDFLDRSGETEAARQIVRGAQGQNRQRDAAVQKLPRDFVHRAVSSGGNDEIHRFFEGLFPATFFYGLIECLMAGSRQACQQLFLAVFTVSGFRIVDQQDSHDWSVTAVTVTTYSANNRPTRVS